MWHDACQFYIYWQTLGHFYENDTILLFPQEFTNHLNSIDKDTWFTIEEENEEGLLFLDINTKRKEDGNPNTNI